MITSPCHLGRTLIAGVGNILRSDDGFGPAVIRALEDGGALPSGARLFESGIGGISLVLELLDGYDALIVVDAVDRGAAPGTLFILEPSVPDLAAIPADEHRILASDMHQAVPGRALIIARALGALPPFVRIVGCQPAETEELSLELSLVVQQAVPEAIQAIRALLTDYQPLTTDERPT